MMTSSNGNTFRVTGPLCGECNRDQWIPLTKSSDVELQSATREPLVELAGWPNHPYSLSGNSCVSSQWNIILMRQKGKTTASLKFIIKIHMIVFIYICGSWQNQSYLRNFHYLKNRVCEKATPNRPNYGRDILLADWCSFDVSLICAWISGWVNNHEGGDLERHRAHYDVITMGV